MDKQRQPDSDSDPGHAEPSAWRANGAHHAAGAAESAASLASLDRSDALVDQRWSSAGAALEPSAEPLALLAAGPPGGAARHRQPYVPGLDDDTPPSGVPVAEPPLWREASRHAPRSADSPDARLGELGSPPAEGLLDPPADSRPPAMRPAATEPRLGEPPAREPRPGEFNGFIEHAESGLPQRVPAEPDVPVSADPGPGIASPAEPAVGRERWTEPELAFIADQLRRDDFPADAPPATFDVDAVVAAVREVAGVEAASVRTNPNGMHTLRLDLADDADPGQVSSTVARLLLERMGLAAAPQHVPQARSPESPLSPEAAASPVPSPGPVPVPGPVPSPAPAPAPESADGAVQVTDPLPAAVPAAPPPPIVPVQSRAPQDGWVYEELDEDPLAPDHEPVLEPVHEAPEPVFRPLATAQPGPRVVIDQVQVRTFGLEAAVEVLLTAGDRQATGVARGPAVDSYLVRLAAVAAAKAIDSLLRGVVEPAGQSRCFVEHTGVVPFGGTEVAVVVLLLVCGGWVEQLTGSALVDGDPRQAVVRATLGAVNRRLEALLD